MIESIRTWDGDYTMIIPETDFNRGTYRELLAILQEIPDKCLDKPVVICDGEIEKKYIRDGVSYPTPNGEEFRSIRSIGFTGPGCKKLGANNMLLNVGD